MNPSLLVTLSSIRAGKWLGEEEEERGILLNVQRYEKPPKESRIY